MSQACSKVLDKLLYFILLKRRHPTSIFFNHLDKPLHDGFIFIVLLCKPVSWVGLIYVSSFHGIQ